LVLSSCTTSFFLSLYSTPRHLPSFPTRRSSDLAAGLFRHRRAGFPALADLLRRDQAGQRLGRGDLHGAGDGIRRPDRTQARRPRSEEHTSELQSRENLVCRLLLEKKKNNIRTVL